MFGETEGNRIDSLEAVDIVKPAVNWVPSISEDRRNYTPQAGFAEKLQRKIDEIKGKASLGSSPAPDNTPDLFAAARWQHACMPNCCSSCALSLPVRSRLAVSVR